MLPNSIKTTKLSELLVWEQYNFKPSPQNSSPLTAISSKAKNHNKLVTTMHFQSENITSSPWPRSTNVS